MSLMHGSVRRPRKLKPQLDTLEDLIAPTVLPPIPVPAIHVALSFSSGTEVSQQVSQVQVSKPTVTVSQSANASGNAAGGTALGGTNSATSGNVTPSLGAQSGNTGDAGASGTAKAIVSVDPPSLQAKAVSNALAKTGGSGPVKSSIVAASGPASATGANAAANTDATGGTAKNSLDLSVVSTNGSQSVSQNVLTAQSLKV